MTVKKSEYIVSSKGSLGLLAYGDIGLREWRKIKKVALKAEKSKDEKK